MDTENEGQFIININVGPLQYVKSNKCKPVVNTSTLQNLNKLNCNYKLQNKTTMLKS